MAKVGTSKYTYERMDDFPKLPAGQEFGVVSRVAMDSQDRLYVFQRKDPPRDGDGKVLAKWETRHAHGLTVDANGDIYVGLTVNQNVDKYVRIH